MEMKEFFRGMNFEELKAKVAQMCCFEPGYVEDPEEEAKCVSKYESSSEKTWHDGSPLDRKRFFVFENDRTLDPKYNMVGAYKEMKAEINTYVTERLRRMEIEEEERAGYPGFDPLLIKHHYDSTFSDDEEAEVKTLFFYAASCITQLFLCREVMRNGTPVTRKKRSREMTHFPTQNTALVIV